MHFPKFKLTRQITTRTSIMNTGVIVHDATPEQKRPYWLRRFWAALMYPILRGHEPRIWERRNSAGGTYYYCYDPYTGRSIYCDNEAEVRIWLEQLPF